MTQSVQHEHVSKISPDSLIHEETGKMLPSAQTGTQRAGMCQPWGLDRCRTARKQMTDQAPPDSAHMHV